MPNHANPANRAGSNPSGLRNTTPAATASTPTPVTGVVHSGAASTSAAGQKRVKGQPGFAGKPQGGGK